MDCIRCNKKPIHNKKRSLCRSCYVYQHKKGAEVFEKYVGCKLCDEENYCKEYCKKHYYQQHHADPRRRLSKYKRSAKYRKLEFNLDLEYFVNVIKQPCAYCDNKLNPFESNGLDRKDSNLGYIKGNIVSCCHSCNCIKWDILSYEEAKSLVSLLLKIRNL